MRGNRIPDENHVARLCWPGTIEDGQVTASSFYLRLGEDGLSVNWLEHFKSPNRESELVEVRKVYTAKELNIRPRARIAVLKVGEVHNVVHGDFPQVEICHDREENEENPSLHDPSHAGIFGMGPSYEEVAELILQTNIKTYPALN